MRVVHVVRQFSPSVGGLEGAVLKLCVALRRKGVDASVVTLDRISKGAHTPLPATDVVAGVPVTRVPFSGSWRYPLAPRVLAHLGRADVIHVHAIDFFFDFLALTRAWHGRPMVASTHGGFFHTRFAQRLKRIYFHTATRTAAMAYRAICASSEGDLAMFKAIAPGNVVLIENGADVEKWSDLASPAQVRTLLYVGRFSSNKQIALLFPLLLKLRELHPDWRLIVAGRPWDVAIADLVRLAEAEGVADAVQIADSPSDAAIAEAIGSASYIVSASRHEGFGISIVEGLSAGLLPVLSQIPPFETLFDACGCGCLFDPAQPEAAARSIEQMHSAAAPRIATLRENCRAVAARYSWPAAADQFIAQYQAACGAASQVSVRTRERTG